MPNDTKIPLSQHKKWQNFEHFLKLQRTHPVLFRRITLLLFRLKQKKFRMTSRMVRDWWRRCCPVGGPQCAFVQCWKKILTAAVAAKTTTNSTNNNSNDDNDNNISSSSSSISSRNNDKSRNNNKRQCGVNIFFYIFFLYTAITLIRTLNLYLYLKFPFLTRHSG